LTSLRVDSSQVGSSVDPADMTGEMAGELVHANGARHAG
jgi:hypothetical protein